MLESFGADEIRLAEYGLGTWYMCMHVTSVEGVAAIVIATMTNKQHKSGRAGLLVWEGSSSFDDIRITGKGIPEFAVKPKGKLATIWAQMKARHQALLNN